jgi:TIR domain
VVLAVFGSALFVGVVFSLFYRLRVKAYVNLKIHPFDVDECEGEDMAYDIFLSCAYEDREVGRWIVDRLERQRSVTNASYKVCYHERDFYPGTMIIESIQLAIERSRRIVCLLSRHFLHSEYCVMEFCSAWNYHIRLNKRRLVVIKWPEVDVSEMDVSPRHEQQLMAAVNVQTTNVDVADVKLFLSTHTYIEYGSDNWWDQLLYSLPINSLPSVNGRADQYLPVVHG